MAKFLFFDTDIVKLLLENEEPSGGAAVQSYVWINGLTEIGNDVSIIAYENQIGPMKSEAAHIKVIPIYDKMKGLRWFRWLYYRLPRTYRILRKVKPDYLYQSIPSWESLLTSIMCRQLGIKYIIRLSNDNLLDERYLTRGTKLRQVLLKNGIKLSNFVLSQNNYQYSLVTQLLPKEKVLKIPNPYMFQKQHQVTKARGSYIAWVAIFQLQKNLRLLYEIASLLEDQEFRIAGSYAKKRDPETDEYVTKLKSLKNVKFMGHINRHQILNFLSEAKYLLNTSYYEGFSNTFLEAMSVGTPVLSTPRVNPDQIIDKYKIGVIYHDSQDLQSRLKQISHIDYQQMSNAAIEYVKEKHDHILLSKQLIHFLEG